MNFKDYQAQAFDPTLFRFTTLNAGKVRARGVEVDFRALPFEGLTLSGGGAYNDAIYKDFAVKVTFKSLKGNSGLYFRIEENGASGVSGFQAEIDPFRLAKIPTLRWRF